MAIVLTDTGALEILNAIFGEEDTPTEFELILFSSPSVITDSIVYANFTFEDFTSLTLAEMTTSLSSGVPMSSWVDKVFTFTGPLSGNASIKGYAVVAQPSNTVWFAELLSTPFTPAENGDKLTLKLRFKLGNGTPG